MPQPEGLSSFSPGSPVVGPVFHYTSGEGLLGLITTGSLWASEASSLNDIAEVRQGWDAISRLLSKLAEGESRDLLLSHASHPVEGRHEVFVLSASTAGDDANQWRLYADGGRGYVVELDGRVPLAVVSTVAANPRPKLKPGQVSFAQFLDVALVTPWRHVLYTDRDILDVLGQLVAAIDAERQALRRIDDEDDYHAESSRVRDEAYGELATVAHLIKTPGFSGENEVRVVVTTIFNQGDIRYRAGRFGIVGYLTLTTAPAGWSSSQILRPQGGEPAPTRLPVKSVRTGPLLSEEHENTVRGFLRLHGAEEARVLRSAIPLR